MTPHIIKMDVYPVAGKDSMLLNLSGAHSPFFTRNVVILKVIKKPLLFKINRG